MLQQDQSDWFVVAIGIGAFAIMVRLPALIMYSTKVLFMCLVQLFLELARSGEPFGAFRIYAMDAGFTIFGAISISSSLLYSLVNRSSLLRRPVM